MDAPDVPELVTGRLRLRAFRTTDLDDYAALHADPEVMRFLGGGAGPWDRGRAWRHLAFQLGHWQLGGSGMWAVEILATGEFAGTIGFAEPEGWPGCELAWILARRFWGNGYATEGGRAALAHAFGVWRKERVVSLIHPGNRASIRVAERLGERLAGRIEHVGREMLCYAVDREADRRGAPASARRRAPRPRTPITRRSPDAGRAASGNKAPAGAYPDR